MRIESRQNPLVKHWTKLRTSRSYRQEQESVLVCSETLVSEIAAHLSPTTRLSTLPSASADYHVTEEIMAKISGLPSPPNFAAEFPMPPAKELSSCGRLLALDGVADPGNLGTLLRSALAFGWEGVFLLPDCADPFHEKVIRASRGAPFRLPYTKGSWETLNTFPRQGRYVADLQGMPLDQLEPQTPCILLLSREGSGVSSAGQRWGQPVTIPMHGEMESLNVACAGAIFMHALQQR